MWKRDNETITGSGAPSSSPTTPMPPASRSTSSRNEVASIGPSISVKGEISGEEDLVIEGRVEGKVDLGANHVTVGKQGRVKADIHGRLIDIQGQVEGNLFGDEQVLVRQSGSVRGNITGPRVSLEDGANFKGSIDMEPKARDERRPSATAPRPGAASGATGGGNAGAAHKTDAPGGAGEERQSGSQRPLPGSSSPGSPAGGSTTRA